MTEKNKNPRTRVGVAPLFAIAGLAAPGAAASFGSSSLQQTLLVLGSATLIGSVLLLLYRWRPIRLGIHALLLCLPIELFYRLSYGGAISPGILSSIFETDSREAFEL